MENKILTRKELAEILRLSVRTIQLYEKEGMPYLKSGNPRYELEKVKEWLSIRGDEKND